MPNTSAAVPGTAVRIPSQSNAGACGSTDSGNSTTQATRAATPTGTLIRNTEPHQKCCSSQPPTIGPSGNPTPSAPTHTAIARRRWSGPNRVGRIPSDSGTMIAAPMPMTARAAISEPVDPLKAAQAEAATKATKPISSSRLRP